MSSDVLILSAHIDDFIIGAGAYVAGFGSLFPIHVVYLSDGVNHEKNMTDMAYRACLCLNIPRHQIHFLGYKNTTFGPHMYKPIYNQFQKLDIHPHLILANFGGDLNQDHAFCNRMARILARPKGNPIALLAYETLSSTEWGTQPFQPNLYVEITDDDWEQKENALTELMPKLREWPYPLSIDGIVVKQQQRGMECGYNRAEAFQAIRWYG